MGKLTNTWTNWALTTLSMFRTVPRQEVRQKYTSLSPLLDDTIRMLLTYLANDTPP
jgi:hypothetical protein